MVRLINDFTRVCKTTENGELCFCDFRINIYECSNSEFYVIVGKILVTICILATLMGCGLLTYLIRVKKQPFFLSATRERGWLRPRPLHSYHLIVIGYMSFEAIHLILLITESYPSIKAAEIGNILINVVSASISIFYTVSIVYSTPNTKFNEKFELSTGEKGINTRFVDMIGIILFLLPIVTWLPLASLTGHFAELNDIKTANLYFTAHFLALVVWEIIYISVLAYFWYKLMSVIKSYIKVMEERHISSGTTDNGSYVESIKKSTRNITVPVMAIFFGLLFQAIIYLIMSLTYRSTTIYSFGWNLFYYWIEYVAFPLLGLSVESLLVFFTMKNNKKLPASPGNSSSSKTRN
ncbi:hypothetical protein C1645_746818 [Glomus cerebriforme]|uniref:Uncharacterized protein n=1 Tax=Glomus cerebriforme TaxID=658196 RepID=A0A397TXU7_9GLOM|nr:hypothetical protein C1645_746818 [Glomus cerebriforme]